MPTPTQILAHKRKLKAEQQARFRAKRGKTITLTLTDAGTIEQALRAYLAVLQNPELIHPSLVGQDEIEQLQALRAKLKT